MIGNQRYAVKNPIHQMTTEIQKTRRLRFLSRRQTRASSGSVGQDCFPKNTSLAVSTSQPADRRKIHTLCLVNSTSQGAELTREATTAPMPRDTSTRGKAQQISVLVEANKDNHRTVFFGSAASSPVGRKNLMERLRVLNGEFQHTPWTKLQSKFFAEMPLQ
jgi:hypothetical protein